MMGKLLRLLAALSVAVLIPSCLDDPEGGTSVPFPSPTNLVGTAAVDGTSIALSWTDTSAQETGFRVEIAPSPIATSSDVTEYAIVGANITTYTYATAPNTTRYFRVFATTSTHQSGPSNVVSVTTPNVPLGPSNFVANVGPTSDKNALLTWTDTPSETGYDLERSENGGAWTSLVSLGANATTHTDTTTVYDTEYRYRIRATSGGGPGPWSTSAPTQTRTTSVTLHVVPPVSTEDISWFTSLAVAPDGTAHISHLDQTWGDTVYTQILSGGGSSSQYINPGFPETLGWTGTSIVRDSGGVVHVVANDVYTNAIYYLTPTGGIPAWSPMTVSASTITDRAIVKLGPADVPHVVFQQGTYLRHGFLSGGTWTSEPVAGNAPDYFGFATGASGALHVSFRRPIAGGYELVYATSAGGGSWSTTVVPTAGSPEFNSIAVDGAGAVHIVYNETTTWGLHHATNASGSWATEVIHQTPGGSWGRFNAVAIESATGRIHVSYQDMLYENLRYARKDPAGTWQLKLLDVAGATGRWTSLALGPAGVYVSCGDATSKELRLLKGTP